MLLREKLVLLKKVISMKNYTLALSLILCVNTLSASTVAAPVAEEKVSSPRSSIFNGKNISAGIGSAGVVAALYASYKISRINREIGALKLVDADEAKIQEAEKRKMFWHRVLIASGLASVGGLAGYVGFFARDNAWMTSSIPPRTAIVDPKLLDTVKWKESEYSLVVQVDGLFLEKFSLGDGRVEYKIMLASESDYADPSQSPEDYDAAEQEQRFTQRVREVTGKPLLGDSLNVSSESGYSAHYPYVDGEVVYSVAVVSETSVFDSRVPLLPSHVVDFGLGKMVPDDSGRQPLIQLVDGAKISIEKQFKACVESNLGKYFDDISYEPTEYPYLPEYFKITAFGTLKGEFPKELGGDVFVVDDDVHLEKGSPYSLGSFSGDSDRLDSFLFITKVAEES